MPTFYVSDLVRTRDTILARVSQLADLQDTSSFKRNATNAWRAGQECDLSAFTQAYESATALAEQFAQAATGADKNIDELVLSLGKILRTNIDENCICKRRT